MTEYQMLWFWMVAVAFLAMFCFYMAGKQAGRKEVNKILAKERRYIKQLERRLWISEKDRC